MIPKFHSLTISDRRQETSDTISLAFTVPLELEEVYRFTQGQYLTLKLRVDGQEVRRSYSICVSVSDYTLRRELRVAIKKVEGGLFSAFVHEHLRIGNVIDVMTPEGRFFTELRPDQSKHYLAFAAGSGITPIVSLMKTTLETEPFSSFTLIYGNRNSQQILFLEEIEALKNLYLTRVKLIHILSAQPQEAELFNGRISADKTKVLLETILGSRTIDQAFICGPSSMIDEVEAALRSFRIPAEHIHAERFGVPLAERLLSRPLKPSDRNAAVGNSATLRVQLDGKIREMQFPFVGLPLLDIALANGLDLPFACKGGVCCTCRAKVLEGEVRMDKNYTLEKWEIDKGFVLTCQCHPVSDTVLISYDER
jgi:ring-1,2-phenylacetyl-CoA epoxidase subunit PaaE